jgi:hypothetical protein
MNDLYWLTDEQLARLSPYFPKNHGKPRVDDRRVLSGIIFVNQNGLRRRDAPREYGPHKTLYNRWKRRGEMGVFTRSPQGLAPTELAERLRLEAGLWLLLRKLYGAKRAREVTKLPARTASA